MNGGRRGRPFAALLEEDVVCLDMSLDGPATPVESPTPIESPDVELTQTPPVSSSSSLIHLSTPPRPVRPCDQPPRLKCDQFQPPPREKGFKDKNGI